MAMDPGVNLEFSRTEKLDLIPAMRAAADAGYRYVEPYVYTPVTQPINSHLRIASETPYTHVDTSSADAKAINAERGRLGLRFSAVDAHATLLLPQIGVPYLTAAVDFAAAVECPIIVSDEGPLSLDWMDLDPAFDLLCFSLEPVVRRARARGVLYAMELHNAITARPDYLVRLLDRFGPDDLGVNFDTGNSFLAGNDPVDYLRRVASRVVHVHIKDIPASQLPERGKVTGTRVGVSAGDGIVDLPGIVDVLRAADYRGVLSVECDTLDQARRSLDYLLGLLGEETNAGASR